MVYHTIKSQLLIALTILYAQVNVCVMSSCMFNKIRSIKSIERRGEREVPPSKKLSPGLPACQFALLETHEALWGVPPLHEIASRPCPLDTSRTPYRASGLPAGSELSFKSDYILPLPPRMAVVRPSIRQSVILPRPRLKQLLGSLGVVPNVPFFAVIPG